MIDLWERHTRYEFELKDADQAVSTMVADASVMHVPTMSGGFGRDALRTYYADSFIPSTPPDTTVELLARSVGDDVIVDECLMALTHDRVIPHLLPGVAPTGRSLEVVFVVVVKFRDSLMLSERLYWDQAQVLAQARLIAGNQLRLPALEEVTRLMRASVRH
ncbi:hypothetical protein A5647_17780 [Mycobacterium sp. 1100029.7]|nr:hypothetical protein A5647_17780 [Mycobacterium sp. 1100029.7]